jgi:uncharacterized protein YPO0396
MTLQRALDQDTGATFQWRAEVMQLVHWGGFHGVTSIDLAPNTTLISGASGTGKSTILDAYLALMMDSNTPFNGASNDAAVGRARGATQRSLLTYLRGKTDDIRENGEAAERVLRGDSTWTWGAVSMTFVDGAEHRFTALRLYYVPRSATKDSDVTKKLCTIAGIVDLKEFEPLAVDKFDKRAIRSRFPSMATHDTYESFAITMHTRLGIGAKGDGGNALRLLARIQAGRPVTTVDDLYKSMVLEPPSTFDAADRAVRHFTDLEAAYEEMETAAAKQSALQQIKNLWHEHEKQSAHAASIDSLGLERGAQSPFAHWAATFESALIDTAVRGNRSARDEAFKQQLEAENEGRTLAGRVSALDRDIDDAGGGTLRSLAVEIEALQDEHENASAARNTFDDGTSVLGLSVANGDDFAVVQAEARSFIATGHDEQSGALQEQREEIQQHLWPRRQEVLGLNEERQSLEGRAGRVPKEWHDARVEAARAAGFDPQDLPFVAELIDVLPEHVEWRTAAEVTLNSVARVMLVDERLLDRLSRAIDHLRWKVRLNFEGVTRRSSEPRDMDPTMLSGKLAYKETPFTPWIHDRLTSPNVDALCVASPAELAGGGRRVTKSGQTRHGQRGAHGRTNTPPIIGFDNVTRLAEIDERLAAINREVEAANADLNRVAEHERDLTRRRDAHRLVADTRWEAIDVRSIALRIDALSEQRDRILESDDRLRELQEQRQAVLELQDEASRQKYRAEAKVESLDNAHTALEERLGQLDAEVRLLVTSGQTCTTDQSAALSHRFSEVADAANYQPDTFPEHLARLAKALRTDRGNAQQAAERASASLTTVFDAYQARWPDPNLGVGLDSYSDYLAILDEITATGLHERRQEWVRRLTGWTGEDLVPLNGAFDSAIEEIQDRLDPVNAILDSLPFGAHRDRLRIDLGRVHREEQTRFRRRLREMSSGATSELTVDQAEAKFKQLRAFIDQIRPPSTPGDRNRREYYLDVRKHIELSAMVIARDGSVRAEFRSLGEKSGGETQELVAFIVGAALRFQLGDETRSCPRFATVLLDEGFVKADSEFAARGVNAWKGLGFQLIVAAPFDKVTALEPHFEQLLGVTKNPTSGHARIDDITDTVGSAL